MDESPAAKLPGAREVTHARVLKVAVPIVLSNATVPILGAVDAGVVGQLGAAAPIGAVGLGSVILTTLYWLFGFLRMGTSGFVAQAEGAGDRAEVSALLSRALLIAGAAGLGLILLQTPVIRGALAIAPASAGVEGLARAYFAIRIWGAPAAIAVFAVTGWLIATERTGGVLVLQLWMNGLNVLLDLWFVLALGWGVEGVAVATLIAEWSGLALGLALCAPAFRHRAWRMAARVLDRARLMRMAVVNTDILIRSMLLELGFISFLFFGAAYGDAVLAANHILLVFLEITAFTLDGFAFAAEALVGQALGARARSRLRRAVIVTGQWGLACVIVLAAVFWLAGPWIIDAMAKNAEVRAVARLYLPWMAVAPLIGLAAWMLDGVFIGATATREMRNAMLVSFAAYALVLAALLPLLANHGLWAALLVFFAMRGVTLGWYYPALERRAD